MNQLNRVDRSRSITTRGLLLKLRLWTTTTSGEKLNASISDIPPSAPIEFPAKLRCSNVGRISACSSLSIELETLGEELLRNFRADANAAAPSEPILFPKFGQKKKAEVPLKDEILPRIYNS